MDVPRTWEDVLKAPALLLSLASDAHKRRVCLERLAAAGFTEVRVMEGVNARTSVDALPSAWAVYGGVPKLDPSDACFNEHSKHQGMFLAQLNAWKWIVDGGHPFASIFEDDVLFHTQWDALAPQYYAMTPKDFDTLYYGSHLTVDKSIMQPIIQLPTFCQQSYGLTRGSAKWLSWWVLSRPEGIRTMDIMLWLLMNKTLESPLIRYTWYVWNARQFPDESASTSKFDHAREKDVGLVFQDSTLPTGLPNLDAWGTCAWISPSPSSMAMSH